MFMIADHISYTYRSGGEGKKALQDVSLSIEAGERIALLGHTGSGKSTLVQHLNGLLKPDCGTVYFHGKDIFDKDYDRKMLRTKVGLVFQYPEYQLFETTVAEDIKFGPRNMNLPPLEVDLRAYEALKMVGIGDELLDVSPFELSGGQKRRVALAGVLAMRPELLILDEPAAGLDAKGKTAMFEILERLSQEQHMAILIISHCMEDCAAFAKRLIVMEQGCIVADGSVKKIFSRREQLESIGLTVPEGTYILQELKRQGVKLDDETADLSRTADMIFEAWNRRRMT